MVAETTVTIEDRRVTKIPIELESKLHFEPYCVGCNNAADHVSKCSGCKLVTYCSKECQKSDWKRHKHEDQCLTIASLRKNVASMESAIQANGCMLMQEVILKYGDEDDPWLGRGEPSMMEMMGLMAPPSVDGSELSGSRNVMDVIAGRFFGLQQTPEYIHSIMALVQKITPIAHEKNYVLAFEEILNSALEMKRLTHVAYPDMADRDLPKVLLKLHRDDDAIAFIRYWIQWRTRGRRNLRDPRILLSKKGEWSFPVEENARLLDITDELRNCQFEQGDHFSGLRGEEMVLPAPFCLVPLVIKLRHVCVHRIRKERARAFVEAALPLPQDTISSIASFITGGVEAEALCAQQMEHADRLMDLIDEKYPCILVGALDESVRPSPRPGKDGIDDDFGFDVGGFLCYAVDSTEASKSPLGKLFIEVVEKRYGLVSFKIPGEIKKGTPMAAAYIEAKREEMRSKMRSS